MLSGLKQYLTLVEDEETASEENRISDMFKMRDGETSSEAGDNNDDEESYPSKTKGKKDPANTYTLSIFLVYNRMVKFPWSAACRMPRRATNHPKGLCAPSETRRRSPHQRRGMMKVMIMSPKKKARMD